MTRYIGKQPAFGNFVKLDAISVVNGQSAYTMQSGSSNFTNYDNVNQFIVSLNGVIQAPTDSFTVSGSTITFASALSTGDVINFILVLGDVLSIGTPSDNTVSTAKIQNTAVNADKLATDAVQTAKIQNDAVTTDKINLISTSSTPSLEAKGTSGQTDGYIQLNCEQNSHGIKLKSPPHSAGQSYTLTFPSTAPATDKYLQTNSSGVLSFADAGGGMYEFISQTTVSSNTTNVDITSLSSSFEDFLFSIQGLRLQNDGEKVYMQIEQDGSFITSGNYYTFGGRGFGDSSGAQTTLDSGSANYIELQPNIGNGTNESYCAEVIVYNAQSTSLDPIVTFKGGAVDANRKMGSFEGAGSLQSTGRTTGVRFSAVNGDIASAKIAVYGRKRA